MKTLVIIVFFFLTTFSISAQTIGVIDTTVYLTVDDRPQFPGGDSALQKFLNDSLRQPEISIDAGTFGTITVSFIIMEDGSIAKPTITKGLLGPGSKDCAKEAIRLVTSLPKWIPGKIAGKAVRSKYSLPIVFKYKESFINYSATQTIDIPKDGYNAKLQTEFDTIFTVVEQMPEFPDGDDALLKYISKNIKYPQGDYSCPPESQYFTFIIEKDGSISNVKAMRESKCKLYDDMLINTLKAMPKWKPGMQNGKPARVQYNLPIKIHAR